MILVVIVTTGPGAAFFHDTPNDVPVVLIQIKADPIPACISH